MTKLILLSIASLVFTSVAFPQGGGKAEPNRIEFGHGRTSTTLAATLGPDQEMEYVFSAKSGQKVTVTNPSTGLFDVRVFSDENNVETEFDSSRNFSLTLPADGDYMLFVRKKAVKTPRRARFAITLSIK